jgi:GT2 family glycosyltransferase
MASVVVVTGDNLAETRVCVEALLAHTDEVHEIVAVDRGSTDGTAEYLARTLESRPNSLVIHGDRTMGPALAHNRGLAAARGKHVVLLSSQAVVTSRWLEILTATADLHGQAGLVGPVTNRAAGVQQIGQVDYDTASLRGLQSFAALLADGNAGSSRRAPRLSGFCLLIKRELMARIGGLDERFELGNYEDNDYCLRAHLAGYECLVAGGCYVHRGGTAEFTDEQIRHLTRIQQQWEIFKDKWGLPVSQNLGDPWDMTTLLAEGFSPGRHFQPLPEGAPTAVASAGRDRSSQTAHA